MEDERKKTDRLCRGKGKIAEIFNLFAKPFLRRNIFARRRDAPEIYGGFAASGARYTPVPGRARVCGDFAAGKHPDKLPDTANQSGRFIGFLCAGVLVGAIPVSWKKSSLS